MANSHFAFGHFDHRHLHGWHFRHGGGKLLFLGAGGAAAIDWRQAVAGIDQDATQLRLVAEFPAGITLALGARRVSAGGVMEQSRQARELLQAAGENTLAGPLSQVRDLVARAISSAEILIEFTHDIAAGFDRPTRFEVLAFDSEGTVTPMADLQAVPGITEYRHHSTTQALPAKVGVRVADGDRIGPLVIFTVTIAY